MRRRSRKPSPQVLAKYKSEGDLLLDRCQDIWHAADLLDTAVRDDIAQGLAYLVHSAYDSIATGMAIDNTEGWISFINYATADWFRVRGFAEWFCLAAGQCFHSSRPRTLAERTVTVINRPRHKTRHKKKAS